MAVLTESLSVVAKAMEGYLAVRARLKFDVAVPTGLVLGAGPIGLLAAITMRACGIKDVVTFCTRDGGRATRVELW